MDTFTDSEHPEEENNQTPATPQEPAAPQTPQSEPQPESGAYHAAGTGRKESPYANSPYVAGQYQQNQYQYQPQTQPPVKPKKEKKTHKSLWRGIFAAVLVVVLVAGGCLITASCVNSTWEKRSAETIRQMNKQIDELQKQIQSVSGSASGVIPAMDGAAMTPAQLYQSNVNSVVAISCTMQTTVYGQVAEGTSSGSGFVLTEDGYVVTNYHVVQNATEITVTTHNGQEYSATVKGYDATNDVAVLKVEATDLAAATIGSSSELAIGDMVVAIGNPLGKLTATETVGYISGINREVTTDNTVISMLQTDAAINPGNSGGPLFNVYGEVIGITTAKYSGTTNSGASIEGIGFAIPIDDVMGIISDLIDYGYVTGAYMGITVKDIDKDAAAQFGLPTEGAYVVDVTKGSGADKAGIQPKDLIVGLDGRTIASRTDLTRALRNYKAGDTATVDVVRGGKELTLTITFDEKPHDTVTETTPQEDTAMPSEGNYEDWFDYFRRFFG
ncbi:MAG: trypsin-like peptidase domain-containing protein [Firmicutes bacterium]|nr:trypsin-like peptidase domain-containing protein [Bacillota bacterium]